jgi:agmatinase
MENDRRCGFSTITARDLDKLGTSGVIQAIRDRVGSSRVYISVDIDVLDPAYAPGKCFYFFFSRLTNPHGIGSDRR